MRRACLLLAAVLLSGCAFEAPPAPAAAASPTTAPPAPVEDPCTDIVLTLLDGQLNGLPTADPATFDKAGRVADLFQARYDEVIASAGIGAARAQYQAEIEAACAG